MFVKGIIECLEENHTSVSVISRASGEGFFKEITYNPLPKNTTPLILLDYNLKSRDHTTAQDGMVILEQIKEAYPQWEVVFFASVRDKNLKRRALKAGAAAFILKNHNAIVRMEFIVKDLLHKHKLQLEREFTKITFIAIGAIGVLLLLVGLILYLNNFLN